MLVTISKQVKQWCLILVLLTRLLRNCYWEKSCTLVRYFVGSPDLCLDEIWFSISVSHKFACEYIK